MNDGQLADRDLLNQPLQALLPARRSAAAHGVADRLSLLVTEFVRQSATHAGLQKSGRQSPPYELAALRRRRCFWSYLQAFRCRITSPARSLVVISSTVSIR